MDACQLLLNVGLREGDIGGGPGTSMAASLKD